MEEFHSELFENALWSSNIKDENNTDSNDSTHPVQSKAEIKTYKQSSYIWKYYRPLQNSDKGYECIICNRRVSLHRGNLNRHLSLMHNITKLSAEGGRIYKKKRTSSRSFIWKYCTKETDENARCHLCNKLLYFGGGNTSNISKHLWRKHNNILIDMETNNKISLKMNRKGQSYVWKYTERLSSQNVRCKLCDRTMSFHGTANLIAHLERVHEITDRQAINTDDMMKNADSAADESSAEIDALMKQRKNPTNGRSLVWKYYKFLSSERVRCSFCKRDFVNQGTSNLRRHLQRMHGVLLDGTENPAFSQRHANKEQNSIHDNDFINKLYTSIDEEHAKCHMCDEVLNITSKNDILEHLKNIHRITAKGAVTKEEMTSKDDEMENLNENIETEHKNNTASPQMNYDVQDIKNYFDIYTQGDETQDSFDAAKPLEMPISNPLSPRSSTDHFVNFNEWQKDSEFNKTLQNLKEERISAETEYFREKAAFYRMQKYLTALQAKKVRAELEQFNRQHTA